LILEYGKNMSQEKTLEILECLPKQGYLFDEDKPTTIICKPKLMPLKSVTLEKLEKMQLEAEKKLRNQQNDNYQLN
jgi:BBSome-interacting protein 1